MAVGVARLGHESQKIVAGPLKELIKTDFGPPLHSLIIPAAVEHLHEIEKDMLHAYSWSGQPLFNSS